MKSKIQLTERWHQLIIDMIRLARVNFSSDKTTILEVGCGIGAFCIWASKKSKDVTGLDLAKSGLRLGNVLRKKFKSRVDFVVAEARYLPIRDRAYDVIVCAETLEHIRDYEKAFNELVRVTKELGYIIVTVPNYINMIRLYLPFDIIRSYLACRRGQPDDVNRFNIFVISKLFKRKDLRIIIMRGIGLFHIPSSSSKIRFIKRRLRRAHIHLNRSFYRLRYLCINIGVIAQKEQ